VHRDAGSLGALDQLAHATIVARVSNIDAVNTLRLRAQSSNDGMESEKVARIGHEGVMRGVGAPDAAVSRGARMARADAVRYNL